MGILDHQSHYGYEANTKPALPSPLSNLKSVANYIKSAPPKRIVVLAGAGISTSAGIPDFRSPDTGLYANLARLNLPFAEAVFDISYFRNNPEPFYTLVADLDIEKYLPTISHSFLRLLNEKSLLSILFTQNIDCLERKSGIPGEKIVEAHGSFASQRCIECKTQYPDDLMRYTIRAGDIPHCLVPQCNGLVKPDIVFYGEPLPSSFFLNRQHIKQADLVIVMGTSLTVQPFASLPGDTELGVPRILINKELVGDLGSRPEDFIMLGDCDEGVQRLTEALGWKEELEKIWLEVSLSFKIKEEAELQERHARMTRDELLEEDIQKLTKEVEISLKLNREHIHTTINQLGLSD